MTPRELALALRGAAGLSGPAVHFRASIWLA
jgi:hypothetical protein